MPNYPGPVGVGLLEVVLAIRRAGERPVHLVRTVSVDSPLVGQVVQEHCELPAIAPDSGANIGNEVGRVPKLRIRLTFVSGIQPVHGIAGVRGLQATEKLLATRHRRREVDPR